MKIMMVLDQPNLYGSELHFLDLADYFNSNNLVKVIVFNKGPLLPLLAQKNIDYKIFKIDWLPSIRVLKAIFDHIKHFSPDIIHSHQPKGNFIMALLKLFYPIKLIITVHSQALDHSLLHKQIVKQKIVYLFHRSIQFFTELFADTVIYVSNASSKTSFFSAKATVIHNWLSKTIFDKLPCGAKSKKTNDILKVVAVGSVTSAKGYDIFVDFIEMLHDHPYRIDIVGSDDTPFANDLKEEIKRRLIPDITFHHHQTNISPYLIDADYFILFSKTETFGLCYIEAMAYGLPVFTLDYPTMREIIAAGNSISNNLIEHLHFLLTLNNNPEEYFRLSLSNASYVKLNFSYSAAMNTYKLLYAKVSGG